MGMQTTERDAITSMKVKCMCLDYLYLKKTSFCIFVQVVGIIMHVLLTGFLLCRGGSRRRKCLEKVGKVQRGSKGSLTPFQRVSQSLDAKKPCL